MIELKAGDALPAFTTPPVTRLALALYCGASGDHNPMHVDIDYARAGGSPDVFAHGMLSMGYLGRLLTNWVPQQRIRAYGVRFVAITQVGEALMPSLCSKLTQRRSLCGPSDPSAFTWYFGTTNSEMPREPSGAPGSLASTRWIMFSARSCSPQVM